MSQKIHPNVPALPSWIERSDCRSCSIFNDVLFSDLSSDDLETILQDIYEPIDHFSYPAGSIIYQEGNEDNAIYTIRSGLVKLVRYLPDGRERIIRLMKATDAIGLERILDRPYGHTAIVLQAARVCRIPVGVLRQLNEDKPKFYRKMMERWATVLFQADDYIMMLLSGTVKQRVVHLIQWLTEFTDRGEKSTVVLLHGSDMAAMLDITPESVSRILAEMKRLKILRHKEGECYEYTKKQLVKYADGA